VDGGIARGFRDVDAARDAARFAVYLDAVSALLPEEKQKTVDLLSLRSGGSGLDVGCGAGAEVRMIADRAGPGGRAVGLDLSEALLTEARSRAAEDQRIEFVAGDAHAMPFVDGEFDGARVERALQHMADPIAVLSEMARVVRPGGRIVAMELDWPALLISGRDLDSRRSRRSSSPSAHGCPGSSSRPSNKHRARGRSPPGVKRPARQARSRAA
jgi:SAM-dependent methyltransferase